MTDQPSLHLADDVLSALVDDQLDAAAARDARSHLAGCPACQQRLGELEMLVGLLHRLPEVEPPRTFTLGPRLVADPPNVIRLQRWYAWTRTAAASLAAVFVFLVAGALYVDLGSGRGASNAASAPSAQLARAALTSQPASGGAAATVAPAAVRPQAAAKPSTSTAGVPPDGQPRAASGAAQPAPAAAPGVAQSAPAAASGAAPSTPGVRSAAPAGDSTDQVAAATSVQPLPTPVPTAVPAAPLPPPADAVEAAAPAPADAATPWRVAASLAGLLAVLILFAAVALRHRLRTARAGLILPTE